MFRKLIRTDEDRAALFARLALGIAIFPHGAQKLLGWFGGGGFSGTIDFFSATFGVPAFITVLVIIGEFFGGLGLIVGFLSRLCAGAVGLIMVGAVFIAGHLSNGFFMNWTGQQAGEGFEYHILAVGLSLVVLIAGGGSLSVDRKLSEQG